MNKCFILGRLGRDVELKTGASGAEFANFSVAEDEYNYQEKKNDTEWFSCTAFGKTAVMISTYFKKGDGIFLEGRMRSSKKDDKTYWNFIVERVSFPYGKKSGGSDADTNSPVLGFTPMDEGECPF